jgi:cytochrome b
MLFILLSVIAYFLGATNVAIVGLLSAASILLTVSVTRFMPLADEKRKSVIAKVSLGLAAVVFVAIAIHIYGILF